MTSNCIAVKSQSNLGSAARPSSRSPAHGASGRSRQTAAVAPMARRFWAPGAFLALVLALVLTLAGTLAFAQTPTAEQLKAFQSLPQAQRDAILQQAGGAGGTQPSGTNAAGSNEIYVQRPELGQSNSQPGTSANLDANPKITGYEQLLIEIAMPMDDRLPVGRPETERPNLIKLAERREQIVRRNPYELSREGLLQLPGFDVIPLAGLTAKQAEERLASDPMLREFTVTVKVLRVDARGPRALKPFGYEMFRTGATAFVPGTDIPVPADYKVGPGDVFDVQLFGQQSKTYTLPVGRDGSVAFPELGPIAVGGLGFGAAQGMLEKRVRQQIIGTQARVRLSDLRSMRVLILGDAEKPGSYVVSSLASVTNALFVGGGVKPIGSLRGIEVKRGGQLIRRLDLYDVLLRGDTSNDVMLQTGDAVFIPPVGPTVAIDGEVRRPAIYELAKERTLSQIVALAGGLSPTADASVVTVERVGPRGEHVAADVDLSSAAGQAFTVQSGDVVRVAMVRPVVDNGITLGGHVYRPGVYAWRDGLHLTDVVRSIDDLQPRADTHYVLVRREAPDTRRVSAVSADLDAALAQRGSAADILLAARDRITVFDTISPRDRVIVPLLEELRTQSRPDDLAGVVYIDGRVNAAGSYPLEPGMRVIDLLRAAGGLDDAAYVNSAELTRFTVIGGERRTVDIRQIDLAAARGGDAEANVLLHPYDLLSIKLTPEWTRQEQIELVGEVRFPGTYLVRRGEKLSSVLHRAGGLTPVAFPQGAVFTREELKRRERDQLDRLATRLQADLATLALQSSQSNSNETQAMSAGQGMLDQLRQTKPVGRLVVDLAAIASNPANHELDVTLRNGDKLVVPRATEEVSVLGEVQNPTSHLYRAGQTRDDLIGLSGGMTARADRKRAYVVRADGSVMASTSHWRGGGNVPVHAGDTVVVPPDAEKMRPLTMWTAVTTIIYNLAIAATVLARL